MVAIRQEQLLIPLSTLICPARQVIEPLDLLVTSPFLLNCAQSEHKANFRSVFIQSTWKHMDRCKCAVGGANKGEDVHYL